MSRFRTAPLLALLLGLAQASFTQTSHAQTPSTPVVDIDGNTYPTVRIGDQVWMAKNLLTTRYANGDAIPTLENPQQWAVSLTGATSIYANDPSNLALGLGRLYNGGAVLDPRGLCPAGWAVPTSQQWNVLIERIGGPNNAGAAMKLPLGWPIDGTAVGASGFSALPAGLRSETGEFKNAGAFTGFWSSTPDPQSLLKLAGVGLVIDSTQVFPEFGPVTYGFSVRCLQRVVVVKLNQPGSNPEAKTITLSGDLADDGGYPIVERGFVWGLQADPSVEQNLGRNADSGTGLGAFSHTVTGLDLDVTYWARAYAITSEDTVYSTGRSVLLEEIPDDGGGDGGGGFNTRYVEDADGNRYAIYLLGGRYWMSSNLRTTRFRDSSLIAGSPTPEAFEAAAGPTWGDPGRGRIEDGLFYNAAAVQSDKGICPEGWHVPSEGEWLGMADKFGGESDAGRSLKNPFANWVGETIDSRTSFSASFLAAPTGRWSQTARDSGFHAYYWTSTPVEQGLVYHQLSSGDPRLRHGAAHPANGLSVRCASDRVFAPGPEISRLASAGPGSARILLTAETSDNLPAISGAGVVWAVGQTVDPTLENAAGTVVVTRDSAGVREQSVDLSLSDGARLAAYVQRADGSVSYSRTLVFASQATDSASVETDAGPVPVRSVYNPYRKTDDEWMTQDLLTGTYRDGSPLQPGDYADTPQGRIYAWSAASDPRGLCPEGWVVPEWNDWRAVLGLSGPVSLVTRLAEFTQSKAIWSLERTDGAAFDAGFWRSRDTGYATVLHESASDLAGLDLRPTPEDVSGLYLSRTPFDQDALYVWELPSTGREAYVHARDDSEYFRIRCRREHAPPPAGKTDLVFSDVSGDFEYAFAVFHTMSLRTILSGSLSTVTASGLLVDAIGGQGALTLESAGPGLAVAPSTTGEMSIATENPPGTYRARFYASTADTTVYSETVEFSIARHPVVRLADAQADSSGRLVTSVLLNDFDPYDEWVQGQPHTLRRDAVTAFQFVVPLPDSTRFDSVSRTGTLSESVQGQVFTHLAADSAGVQRLSVAFASSGPLPEAPYTEQPLLNLHLSMTAPMRTDTVALQEVHLNSVPIVHAIPGILRSQSLFTMATGDVDGDGEVRAFDASLVLRQVVGIDPLPELDPLPWEPYRFAAADVDGNGSIQAMDASHILRYLVGLITEWPSPGAPSKAVDPVVSASFSGNTLHVLASAPGGFHALEIRLPAVEGVVYGDPVLTDFDGASSFHTAPDGSMAIALAAATPADPREVQVPVAFTESFSGAYPDGAATLDAAFTIDTRAGAFTATLSSNGSAVSTQEPSPLPDRYELRANHPNPFNPATRIEYALPEAAEVRLEVFDAAGRKVAVLAQGARTAGVHSVTFDASALSSGLYLYRLVTPTFTAVRTMVLLK